MLPLADEIFRFGIWDYSVFGAMLLVSTGIGVYFGFFAKSANTTNEYLMGERKMKVLPIAISLVASQLSGISIIAAPSEIYAFGINFMFANTFAAILGIPILSFLVIPVFYQNNISNCYDYLELRFDSRIKKLITIVFLIKVFLILPVYMFVPSLAFSQVTGINIHKINVIVCSICVIYTMFGGIKAVVWTDVVQGFIMLASVVVVASFGIYKVGGFQEVFTRAAIHDRLTINTNFDLTTRLTVWNCLISGIFLMTSYVGFSQSSVQRLVSLPTIEQAQKSIYYFGLGFVLIIGFCNFTGLIMFANYSDCDPVRAGVVQKQDQMLPFFVQQTVGNIVGMSGFFISSVFSASLSTMSANLNSLSGIIYFDYIKPNIKHTEEKANFIMKIIVCLIGIYCIFSGFFVEKFHSLVELSITLTSVAFGCLFGVFMMGFFVPKAHSKATFIAIVASLIISISQIVTGKIYMYLVNFKYYPLPTSVEKCDVLNINITIIIENVQETIPEAHPLNILKMSFEWYSVIGSVLIWIIGIPLSYLMTHDKDETSNINLYAPIVRRILTK